MMNMRIVEDISDFIFIEDKPKKADAILISCGAYPELPEMAAKLWREGDAYCFTADKILQDGIFYDGILRCSYTEDEMRGISLFRRWRISSS